MNHWTKEGIENLKNGDRAQAERALRIAVQEAPREVDGWLWLSKAVIPEAEKVTALLRVLDLDSRNETARQMLDLLQNRQGDETLPHVNPFSLEEAGLEETRAAETPAQPFASTEILEENPAPIEEKTSRLTIQIALIILTVAVVLVLIGVLLPRF